MQVYKIMMQSKIFQKLILIFILIYYKSSCLFLAGDLGSSAEQRQSEITWFREILSFIGLISSFVFAHQQHSQPISTHPFRHPSMFLSQSPRSFSNSSLLVNVYQMKNFKVQTRGMRTE